MTAALAGLRGYPLTPYEGVLLVEQAEKSRGDRPLADAILRTIDQAMTDARAKLQLQGTTSDGAHDAEEDLRH